MGSGIAFIIGGFVLEVVQQGQPLTLPVVGELRPWQQTFVYVGLPGLLLAVVFLFIREPKRKVAPEMRPGASAVFRFYQQNFKLLCLHHLGFLSFALAGYAFVFWSVSYFVRVHDQDAAQAAQTFGWIFLLSGPIGPVLAALFARALTARGLADGNILAGMIMGCIGVPFVVLIQFAPCVEIAWLLYVPAMIFVNAPFGLANGSLPVIAPAAIHAPSCSHLSVCGFDR